jgi:hypothetical protein
MVILVQPNFHFFQHNNSLLFQYKLNLTSHYCIVYSSSLLWFEHKGPPVLKISGITLCHDASRGKQYGTAYTDALSRMLTSDDDKVYVGTRKREKHYMAYSWTVSYVRPFCTALQLCIMEANKFMKNIK